MKRFTVFVNEMSMSEVRTLERTLDRLFEPYGVDIVFTRHVIQDRLLTGQREGGVTAEEIIDVFKRFIARYNGKLEKKEWEAVIKDIRTKLNLPVIYKKDHLEGDMDMIVKTIMKKRDFKAGGSILTVR